MTQVIVKFLKTHGRYVKNDVAGFPKDVVDSWPVGTCKPFDPDAAAAGAGVDVGQMADNDARAKALDGREALLDERYAELTKREAAVKAAEDSAAAAAIAEPQGGKKASKAAAGDPPVQGSKK